MSWIVANNGVDVVTADEEMNPVCTCESKLLAPSISAVPEFIAAALKFVNKVETGKAKSVETYNELKAALKKAGY